MQRANATKRVLWEDHTLDKRKRPVWQDHLDVAMTFIGPEYDENVSLMSDILTSFTDKEAVLRLPTGMAEGAASVAVGTVETFENFIQALVREQTARSNLPQRSDSAQWRGETAELPPRVPAAIDDDDASSFLNPSFAVGGRSSARPLESGATIWTALSMVGLTLAVGLLPR
jgi:hypothetical protein